MGNSRVGTVRDWMSRDLVTVRPEVSVERTFHLMETHGVRHVLVVDGDFLVGIVSNRDVRGLLIAGDPEVSAHLPVGRVMSEGPMTVSPDVPLTEAVRQMLERKIGALPVVDEARLVGILTRADALEALLVCAEGDVR